HMRHREAASPLPRPDREMMITKHPRTAITILVVGSVTLAGCGSSNKSASRTDSQTSSATTTSAPPPAVAELAAAQRPQPAQFPPARGRTLQQLASTVGSTAQLGAATGT